MSTPIDDSGPAFPLYLPEAEGDIREGMTLRDYFAGKVISRMVMRDLRRLRRDACADGEDLTLFDDADCWKDAAKEAYGIADAMIEARKGTSA